MEDPEARQMLADLPGRYFDAIPKTEKAETLGGLGFGIVLALVTAGAGAAASILSKSKYFEKAAALIQKISKVLKRRKLSRKQTGEVNQHHQSVAPGDQKTPLVPKAPKPLRMNKHKAKCFKMGDKLRQNTESKPSKISKEYYKQLKAQELGINEMSVGEYLNNRRILNDLVAKHGSKKARAILTNGGKAQIEARQDLEAKIFKSVKKALGNKGFSSSEAKRRARESVDKEMKRLAALHDPDLIAGGGDKISRMGNANVNYSIGSQWKGRVGDMDKAAKQAFNTYGADAKMNIELNPCTGIR